MRNIPVVFLAVAILTGCAGTGVHEPITPSSPVANAITDPGNRYVWGLWDVRISADHQSVEVIPWRSADMHLNVVRLLEVTACHTCLTVENIHPAGPNELEADVRLAHPFPGLLKFTGFDVRGIFIAQTDFTFPVSGRKIGWGNSVPRMLNPDGYTPLFNPTEYPPTFPAALGYIPGKYATGGDLSATLNPFVAYRQDAPRRMFEAGGAEIRTVHLYAPPGPIHFGYAVDACWEPVDHEIVDPLVDFPPDANCLEAYRLDIDFPYGINSSWMSQNPVTVEVFDHQGVESISTVTIEAPELFSGEVALALSTQTGEESWLFSGMITNELEATEGTYPALVMVVDTNADQNLGAIDGFTVTPAEVKEGWARTWGGADYDSGFSVATDNSGNVFVAGSFQGTVDFDPGSGADIHASNGESDVFLSKFDSSGTFLWARTWGGGSSDWARSIATAGWGVVYVTGVFSETVDFDPGSGVDSHASNGSWDVFLTTFDSSGNHLGARTWGGGEADTGNGVAVGNSGDVYVTGWYTSDPVDFDPGSGVDSHACYGGEDAFLSKFDPVGNLVWARTWGADLDEEGSAVAVDGLECVHVAGSYRSEMTDFDPGSGEDYHGALNGRWDVFLSKFDSSGGFIWARTWGGDLDDCGWDAAIDASSNAYVTGCFQSTADFDPGSGVDNHISNGENDIFLTKLDSSGNLIWARTWGGSQYDWAWSVAVDSTGSPCVTGSFADVVDFDPGSGVDSHTTNGSQDVFLSRLDSSGSLLWAKTWGGPYGDEGRGVAVDGAGISYTTGVFFTLMEPGLFVDFDPGPGIDNHTCIGWTDVFLSKFPPDGNW